MKAQGYHMPVVSLDHLITGSHFPYTLVWSNMIDNYYIVTVNKCGILTMFGIRHPDIVLKHHGMSLEKSRVEYRVETPYPLCLCK